MGTQQRRPKEASPSEVPAQARKPPRQGRAGQGPSSSLWSCAGDCKRPVDFGDKDRHCFSVVDVIVASRLGQSRHKVGRENRQLAVWAGCQAETARASKAKSKKQQATCRPALPGRPEVPLSSRRRGRLCCVCCIHPAARHPWGRGECWRVDCGIRIAEPGLEGQRLVQRSTVQGR